MVRKAIAGAVEAIASSDDAIGRELRVMISTGLHCSYRPDPNRPRRWSVVPA